MKKLYILLIIVIIFLGNYDLLQSEGLFQYKINAWIYGLEDDRAFVNVLIRTDTGQDFKDVVWLTERLLITILKPATTTDTSKA